jgi:hypothetical protein
MLRAWEYLFDYISGTERISVREYIKGDSMNSFVCEAWESNGKVEMVYENGFGDFLRESPEHSACVCEFSL